MNLVCGIELEFRSHMNLGKTSHNCWEKGLLLLHPPQINLETTFKHTLWGKKGMFERSSNVDVGGWGGGVKNVQVKVMHLRMKFTA